jgi:hypothetical protein
MNLQRERNVSDLLSLEYMPSELFLRFLEILLDLRGRFIQEAAKSISPCITPIFQDKDCNTRLRLESLDPEALERTDFDSQTLLELCHPE